VELTLTVIGANHRTARELKELPEREEKERRAAILTPASPGIAQCGACRTEDHERIKDHAVAI
jgi:hypothetical protein